MPLHVKPHNPKHKKQAKALTDLMRWQLKHLGGESAVVKRLRNLMRDAVRPVKVRWSKP